MTPLRLPIALVAFTLLFGCASDPARVSQNDLDEVRLAYDGLRTGTPKDEALAAFSAANVVKLSSSAILGRAVEEYKIEAFHDDDWSKSRDMFVRFLYFVEGDLVDVSDARVDFRHDPEIVASWGGLFE